MVLAAQGSPLGALTNTTLSQSRVEERPIAAMSGPIEV